MLPGVDFQGESIPAAMIGASLQLEVRRLTLIAHLSTLPRPCNHSSLCIVSASSLRRLCGDSCLLFFCTQLPTPPSRLLTPSLSHHVGAGGCERDPQ